MLPTLLVVLLRLLMPAASLSLTCENAARHDSTVRDPVERASAVGARLSSSYLRPRRLRREGEMAAASSDGDVDAFAHLGRRMTIEEFLSEVSEKTASDYESWKVVSITWVKALASHMSHEFIQFVVEDTRNGAKRRLIADRQETGDWLSITPTDGPLEMSDMFKGLGSGSLSMGWKREVMTPYKDRHMLPLPLVSVVFDYADEGPTLRDMAELLANISARCKEYNPLREHCWWYSEAVIHGATVRWKQQARLHEWAWARYRYSFVICNRWIRRPVLESAARRFEQKCLSEELKY